MVLKQYSLILIFLFTPISRLSRVAKKNNKIHGCKVEEDPIWRRKRNWDECIKFHHEYWIFSPLTNSVHYLLFTFLFHNLPSPILAFEKNACLLII